MNGSTSLRTIKTLRWIVTGLAAVLMLLASVPDLLRTSEAQSVFAHLGYPIYLLPFLGMAKTLGVIAVLAPGFRRLKEWAFAGLIFDVLGALYSHLSVGDPPGAWMPAAVALLLLSGSYASYRAVATYGESDGSTFTPTQEARAA